jgi:hypothetical protein
MGAAGRECIRVLLPHLTQLKALEPMALAILTLFRAEQRENEALSRYAVSKAVECLHYPRNG